MHTLKTLCALLILCCIGAAITSPRVADAQERRGDRRGYYTNHRLDIPPGHYPPPGECKLWYPDRPAGHQPPPTDCRRLIGRPFGNAIVLHHDGVFDPYYRYDDRRVIPRVLREIFGFEDDYDEDDDDRDRRGDYSERRVENILAEHYPPRGKCRLWFEDRPAGKQPSPVSCRNLYGRDFDDDVVVLYDGRAWDPYATYDWRTVPDVILRMFR